MLRREWMSHRQAYTPRLWPTTLLGTVVAVALAQLLPDELGYWAVVTGVGIGVVCGAGGMSLHWAIWRRRHPVLSVEQAAQVMREAARWN